MTLAAGAISVLGTVAFAQNVDTDKLQPSVTVQAPRVVQHQSAGINGYGMSVEKLSLTRRFSYADLNLDTPEGKAALRARIRITAREACQELSSRYPSAMWVDDMQTCVRNALFTWMPQVHLASATYRPNGGARR
jgi:UrcA family protein